jgi:hypothetical protein
MKTYVESYIGYLRHIALVKNCICFIKIRKGMEIKNEEK